MLRTCYVVVVASGLTSLASFAQSVHERRQCGVTFPTGECVGLSARVVMKRFDYPCPGVLPVPVVQHDKGWCRRARWSASTLSTRIHVRGGLYKSTVYIRGASFINSHHTTRLLAWAAALPDAPEPLALHCTSHGWRPK